MKRTFVAMGVGVLASLMFVPYGPDPQDPFFKHHHWQETIHFRDPFFGDHNHCRVQVDEFVLQTMFVVILAAVLVNIRLPRRKRATVVREGSPKPPVQTTLHWQDLPPGWVYFLLVAVLLALVILLRLLS